MTKVEKECVLTFGGYQSVKEPWRKFENLYQDHELASLYQGTSPTEGCVFRLNDSKVKQWLLKADKNLFIVDEYFKSKQKTVLGNYS